jgi:hypothetical protein
VSFKVKSTMNSLSSFRECIFNEIDVQFKIKSIEFFISSFGFFMR